MRALYDVPAPAKVNLFLHVVGRRADGYHLLQSVFMLIDWCDHLQFECNDAGRVQRVDGNSQLPASDLTVQAAQLLRQHTGCRHGVDIHLQKNIPLQAGLGGGSSDAATTLLALNRLWDLRLDAEQLVALGLRLGADVPFFLGGHNAWIEGVGEQSQAVALPPALFAVVKPPQGLSTAAVFAATARPSWSAPATIANFAAAPFAFGRNDLQEAAQRLCPQVADALSRLSDLGLEGRVTGAGSAVFARMPPAADAQQDVLDCPAGWQARLCHNLPRHPLCDWISSRRVQPGVALGRAIAHTGE